jgi:peptidoglycan/xylan/chitin deacetylase (PgdA/CDA1 family)
MFNGKMKALTFSYDDGTLQDERLIDIFNKYNLKATFNINSGMLGVENSLDLGGIIVDHTKWEASQLKKVYAGHEVAVHTISHPNLTVVGDQEVIRQVEDDRIRLTELMGYEVCGMAYPCGGTNHNDRVAEIIKRHTNVKYARTVNSSYSFDLQDNLYRFHPTVYHKEWEQFEKLVRAFIDLKPEKPALFYVWGHAFEFDEENTWQLFEDICKDLSNRDDIFYGTNKEVLL